MRALIKFGLTNCYLLEDLVLENQAIKEIARSPSFSDWIENDQYEGGVAEKGTGQKIASSGQLVASFSPTRNREPLPRTNSSGLPEVVFFPPSTPSSSNWFDRSWVIIENYPASRTPCACRQKRPKNDPNIRIFTEHLRQSQRVRTQK